MKAWLLAFFIAVLTHGSYFGLIGVLLVAGMGLPLPEDIPLFLAGNICSPDGLLVKAGSEPANVYVMILAGMVGVLAGDTFVFYVGRHGLGGNNIVARHIRKVMTPSRRAKVDHHFHRFGAFTVFIGRFAPGLRSLVFASAGMSKMAYWKFMLIDGFAACISVPVFIWLGYHFAAELAWLLGKVDSVQQVVMVLLVAGAVGGAGYWLLRWYRRWKQQKAAYPPVS